MKINSRQGGGRGKQKEKKILEIAQYTNRYIVTSVVLNLHKRLGVRDNDEGGISKRSHRRIIRIIKKKRLRNTIFKYKLLWTCSRST